MTGIATKRIGNRSYSNMKLALEVVLGKKTLDQARRQLPATQDYFYWYIHYYLPISNAKQRLNLIRKGSLPVILATQHLTAVVSEIFTTLKQEEAALTPAERMNRDEMLDWSINLKGIDAQTIVAATDHLIGKYISDVGYTEAGTPVAFASLNQLSNAYIALQKLDKQFKGLGRLTLAVLLGTLSVEDF